MTRSPISLGSSATRSPIFNSQGDNQVSPTMNPRNTSVPNPEWDQFNEEQLVAMEDDHGSDDEEHEMGDVDDIQVQQDELGRIKIQVVGTTFDQKSAMKKLRNIIHSRYNGDWITFSEVPVPDKKLWFDQFAMSFWWDEGNYESVKAVWRIKCSEHLRNTFRKARQPNGRQPHWISDENWASMLHKWQTNEKFKKMSKINKKNRAQVGVHGFAAYTGGSISVAEHIKRFKKVNKRAPTMREVMELTYQKKSGEWSGTRPVKTMEVYNELLAAFQRDNDDSTGDSIALWVKAAGGVKKGHVFGLGSQVCDVPPELLEKYSFASGQSSQSPTDQRQIGDVKKIQAAMEQRMKNMQNEILSNVGAAIQNLTTQLSSLIHQQSFSQSMQAAMQPTTSFSNLFNPNLMGGSSMATPMFDPNAFNVQAGRFQDASDIFRNEE